MSNTNNTRITRPSDVKTILELCMARKRPVFIWGPPGIGKSDLVNGIAAEQSRRLIDLRLLLLDPTDIKGIPYYNPTTKTMAWAAPGELPEIVSAETLAAEEAELVRLTEYLNEHNEFDKDASIRGAIHDQTIRVERTKYALEFQNAILFLDELNAAPPSVQAAAYQLVLNRKVGEYKLPDGVSILAAGNRETDKGVTFRMPTPLANRLIHIEMGSNFDDWSEWAIKNNIDSDILGYLSANKHRLHDFDPKSAEKAFGSPRSWSMASDVIKEGGINDDLITTIIAGTVGEGNAIEFAAHRRFASSLPTPDDCLTGKVTDLKVTEISAKYSLVISMCYTLQEWLQRANDESNEKYTIDDWHVNVDYFFRYTMDNFETEMNVLAAKTALRDYRLPISQRKLKNFSEFHKRYGKAILGE